MQLGSTELQIFVALLLVLGVAFVALVCDLLKGNNQQLRELNIELRTRQDERERMGLFEPFAHPIAWLQGLAALAKNPGLADTLGGAQPATAPAPSAVATPADLTAEPASAVPGAADLAGGADRNPQRRHRYDEFKAASKTQTWATKEELEQLAGRAARIRARHEASQRKTEESIELETSAPAAESPRVEQPAALKPELLKQEFPKAEPKPATPRTIEIPARVLAETPEPAQAVSAAPVAPVEPPVPVAEPVSPAQVAAETEIAEAPAPASEPPMAEAPAPSPWVFRPIEPESKRTVDIVPTATAALRGPILKPEAPSIWSEPVEAATPTEVPAAVIPTPDIAEEVVAPLVVEAAQPAVAAAPVVAPEPEIPSLESLAVEPPPLRTRIRSIEVPSIEEAATEDLTERILGVRASAPEPEISIWRTPIEQPAPAAAAEPPQPVKDDAIPVWRAAPPPPPSGIAIDIDEPQPLALKPVEPPPAPIAPPPPVESRPVETESPAFDVAALQKATGPSRAPQTAASYDMVAVEAKLDLPPGLHESAVLSKFLENQTPFSGVVVAIGLNDYDTLRDKLSSGTDSVAALSRMVLSMLRAQDFACRFQEDEYILIYPGERGSSAQRRLFQVSEKLWDFQLRSLGNLAVMFSWGGLEVTNETLAEAVASARERMYQTKRNRKPGGLDFASGRKKVVNG